MKLYLVQHAQAESKEVDPQRPLTEQGRSDIRKVAAFIKPLNLKVENLWHSGKKRAVQTAEAIAEVVTVRKDTAVRNGLAPNDDVVPIKKEVEAARRDTMLVGHLPFMDKLASLLLTGSESAGTIAFKQAGIVCLEYSDENRWQFNWMITPELLA